MLRNLESLGLTKPTVNEIRENSVQLRLKGRINSEQQTEKRAGQAGPT